jgi:hypothetical protein
MNKRKSTYEMTLIDLEYMFSELINNKKIDNIDYSPSLNISIKYFINLLQENKCFNFEKFKHLLHKQYNYGSIGQFYKFCVCNVDVEGYNESENYFFTELQYNLKCLIPFLFTHYIEQYLIGEISINDHVMIDIINIINEKEIECIINVEKLDCEKLKKYITYKFQTNDNVREYQFRDTKNIIMKNIIHQLDNRYSQEVFTYIKNFLKNGYNEDLIMKLIQLEGIDEKQKLIILHKLHKKNKKEFVGHTFSRIYNISEDTKLYKETIKEWENTNYQPEKYL